MATMLEPTTTTTTTTPARKVDLTGRAVLVKLHVKCWPGVKQHRDLADEAMRAHGADPSTAKRLPVYLVSESRLKELSKEAQAIRKYHNDTTLVWETGKQILKSGQILEYTQTLRRMIPAYEQSAQQFIDDYPALKAEMIAKSGDIFTAKDHPAQTELAAKFTATFSIEPMAQTHWIVDAVGAEFQAIAAEYNEGQQARVKDAAADGWERLYKPLAHLAKTLTDPGAKFKDSLVGNVASIVDSLDALNLLDDPNLSALGDEIRRDILTAGPATLYGAAETNPQELRDNQTKRQDIAAKASDIAAQMAGFMSND